MNFPWPRIWSIACPTFPASATKAMPHTRSASSSGTRPAIPAKSNEAPCACPSWIYNNRNRVERLWARLKEWRAPLRENRQILHGRPLPCRHLRLDQERLQAITGPSFGLRQKAEQVDNTSEDEERTLSDFGIEMIVSN